MTPPRGTIFLERDSYRRRRIMDGARILPVAGFVLILLPVLWSFDSKGNIAVEAVYLFALWGALILVAAIMARPLRNGLKRDKLPPVASPLPDPLAVPTSTVPPTSPVSTVLTGLAPGNSSRQPAKQPPPERPEPGR